MARPGPWTRADRFPLHDGAGMTDNTQAGLHSVPGMSLYVHVPFCKTKCPYCDFNTYQGIENLMGPYLKAVTLEMSLWGEMLGQPKVNTVFFGGGTPSYLPPGHVQQVLATADSSFSVSPDAEITIEANPGDLDQTACEALLRQGVNRLSIGVQSLDNGLLTLLGRRHTADEAVAAFQAARNAGFSNVNLDLMYGLPHQALSQWEDTLERLLDQSPAHISLYCLTLEEGTPLHRWVEQGKLPGPDPDLAADMYHHAESALELGGYHHYEISNWCLPGLESRHNMAYWLNDQYLGVGPGAHSSLAHHRFWDISSPVRYVAEVERWTASGAHPAGVISADVLDGIPPVGGYEYCGGDTACAETMILGLRLLDGMDLEAVSAGLGVDLASRYEAEIRDSVDLGLLERQDNILRLTRPAYLIANQVFTRFVE